MTRKTSNGYCETKFQRVRMVFFFSVASTIGILLLHMHKMNAYIGIMNRRIVQQGINQPTTEVNITTTSIKNGTMANEFLENTTSTVKTLASTTTMSSLSEGTQQLVTERRKVVILLSNQRSGSTFLGEIFNQNPNAYYEFEPLLPYTTHCTYLETERIQLLSDFLRCNFTSMQTSYRHAFNVTKFPDMFAKCVRNNMCFYERNTGLTQRYANLCYMNNTPADVLTILKTRRAPFRFSSRSKTCGLPFKIPLLKELCDDAKIVVYKILRVCSLESLDPLLVNLTQAGYDVRIVHLVRDPRAVMSSQLSLKIDGQNSSNFEIMTELLCGRYRRNLRYNDMVQDNFIPSSATWKRNYLRIRYEDLATNFSLTASRIYSFLEIPMPESVHQWITNSQPSMRQVLKDLQEESILVKQGKGDKKKQLKLRAAFRELRDPFSVKHDPNEIANKWRKHLLPSLVYNVQKRCSDVMKKLGYIIFTNITDVRNFSLPTHIQYDGS